MATAEELLAITSIGEEHIVIGDDRIIRVPDKLKRIAVQYDHNIETVTFDCPRFWDNHDMSTMAVYINYMLPDGYKDSYPADNITADGETMHFDWTVSNNVTRINGNLAILVCVKNVTTEGEEVNHWNSELCKDMYISEGMEITQSVVDSYDPDLVTQLLLRMDSVEKINIAADEMQAIIAEAREIEEVVRDGSNHIKGAYANTIKDTARGTTIELHDVSPIEHPIKGTVKSKNLLSYPYYPNSAERVGVTITANVDGGITLNGTSTASWNIGLFGTELDTVNLPAGTYTFSLKNGDSTRCYLVAGGNGSNVEYIFGTSITFTLTEPGNMGFCLLQITEGAEFNNLTVYPQLEVGSIETEYEPYKDPSTITLTVISSDDSVNVFPSQDGSFEFMSNAPMMTITTDTLGAIIELEYNVDTETRFYDLVTAKRIQEAVDTWLTANFTSAEGVSFGWPNT